MKTLIPLIAALIVAMPAAAFDLESDLQRLAHGEPTETPSLAVSQGNGMTLSQAVDSVRRRGNVERIVSAETRVDGDREMHHIRYMTKDGKVRTTKVRGRRLR